MCSFKYSPPQKRSSTSPSNRERQQLGSEGRGSALSGLNAFLCVRRRALTHRFTEDVQIVMSWLPRHGGSDGLAGDLMRYCTRATCRPALSSAVPFWDLRAGRRRRRGVQGRFQTRKGEEVKIPGGWRGEEPSLRPPTISDPLSPSPARATRTGNAAAPSTEIRRHQRRQRSEEWRRGRRGRGRAGDGRGVGYSQSAHNATAHIAASSRDTGWLNTRAPLLHPTTVRSGSKARRLCERDGPRRGPATSTDTSAKCDKLESVVSVFYVFYWQETTLAPLQSSPVAASSLPLQVPQAPPASR